MGIISRTQAKEQGLTYYFTGKECPSGHLSERFVSNFGCVLCVNEQYRKRFSRYPEKYRESCRNWYNKTKEWRNTSSLRRFNSANRIAKKLQRTPKWADTDKIREIYKNKPDGYEVDHIIPLQGKLVSGLHVPDNLQYLTPFENQSKKNKFDILYEHN